VYTTRGLISETRTRITSALVRGWLLMTLRTRSEDARPTEGSSAAPIPVQGPHSVFEVGHSMTKL
jgi:hypothetical protein